MGVVTGWTCPPEAKRESERAGESITPELGIRLSEMIVTALPSSILQTQV
jgi:hypothetical protein